MIKKAILAVLAVVVLGLVILVAAIAMQPNEYVISRNASYNAPAERIFEQVNDLHKWDAWSPWAKLDPAMKSFYSGPGSGPGAVYEWSGNDEVGRGKMTIAESHPSDLVKLDLEFIEPMASKAVSQFSFKPDGPKTNVTWSMKMEQNFVSKAFCLVMDLDQMIGKDLERGLSQLRPVVETAQ